MPSTLTMLLRHEVTLTLGKVPVATKECELNSGCISAEQKVADSVVGSLDLEKQVTLGHSVYLVSLEIM